MSSIILCDGCLSRIRKTHTKQLQVSVLTCTNVIKHLPSEFAGDFKDLFPYDSTKVSGSLGDTLACSYNSPSHAKGWTINSPGLLVDLPSHYIRHVFDDTDVELLTELYSNLYKVPRSTLAISSTFEKYSFATVNGVLFGSQKNTHCFIIYSDCKLGY